MESFKCFTDSTTFRIEFINEATLYVLTVLHSVFMLKNYTGRERLKGIEFKSQLGLGIIGVLCVNFGINIAVVVYSVLFDIIDTIKLCFNGRNARKQANEDIQRREYLL